MENQSTQNLLKKNILILLSYWKLFVLSLCLFLSLAYVYIRYSTRIYSASVTILVNDPTAGGSSTELSAFSDKFSIYNQNRINLSNEINILTSSEVVYNAIKYLKLNINYYSDGNIKSEELYNATPITLEPVEPNNFNEAYFGLIVKIQNNYSFEIYAPDETLIGNYRFNTVINYNNYIFKIIKKFDTIKYDKVLINVMPINQLVGSYKARTISTKLEETTIVNITFTDTKTDRAKDYLDCLVKNYESVLIKDKKIQLSKTYNFVSTRLSEIEGKLGGVELNKTKFREDKNIANFNVETNLGITKSEQLITDITENDIQLNNIKELYETLKNSDLKYIPSNLKNISSILQSQIYKYNDQLVARNNLADGSKAALPSIVRIDSSLKTLKDNIIEGLNGSILVLESQNNSLKSRYNSILNQLAVAPSQDNQLIKDERSIAILSDMFRYLLNKKEETAILLFSISSNIKVLEPAATNFKPIYPAKTIIYFAAFALALIFPILFILIKQVFDTKIKNKEDILSRSNNISFLGEIIRTKNNTIIEKSDSRSILSESFRISRSNIDFILKSSKNGYASLAKKIFVTSSVPKEGKTFVSVNLAFSYSQLNKKVLLIGFDIRNPKLTNFIQNINSNNGITDYLVSDNDSIKKYIQKNKSGIDIISSGSIPPNPTELLTSPKISLLFKQLETEYDYIIVDTAPTAIVSDTLLLADYADLFIYIFRHNYSDSRFVSDLDEHIKTGKLSKVSVILNDVSYKSGYGYYGGYGYGYGKRYGYSYGNVDDDNQNFVTKMISKLKFWA